MACVLSCHMMQCDVMVMSWTTPVLLCTTKYYPVLQSTTPVLQILLCTTPVLPCTTKYYSSTTLFYKVLLPYYKYYSVLLQYYPVLQSTTPVLPCSTKYYSRTTNTTLCYSSTTLYYKYYSSTTLYYKVPLKYYKVLLQYYKAAIGKEQILKMYQDCKMWILVDFSCHAKDNHWKKMHIFLWITESNQGSSNLNPSIGNLCQDSACV